MKTSIQTEDNIDTFPTEFASVHFGTLRKLHQRVLATADNPDAPMAEVDKAITMEIKIANYLYKVQQRKERAEKAKQPRAKRPEGGERCPTAPPPVGRVPTPGVPQSAPADSPNSVPSPEVPPATPPAPAPNAGSNSTAAPPACAKNASTASAPVDHPAQGSARLHHRQSEAW